MLFELRNLRIDVVSMQEVVRRRYSRMIEEETALPDLIITDGGKGQMDVVREVIVDGVTVDGNQIPYDASKKQVHVVAVLDA